MNRIKLIITSVFLFATLQTFSQVSGGQIRRSVKKQSGLVTNKKASSSQPRSIQEQTGQSTLAHSSPSIQPIPISSLARYNIVVATFSILGNAQGECQKLRDSGWGAQIFGDSNMYYVLMVGMSDEPEAILYRDHARKTYPAAWIMYVENGRFFKL